LLGRHRMGERIGIEDAASPLVWCVPVNDWTARDIQAWEYQPLGPFLARVCYQHLAVDGHHGGARPFRTGAYARPANQTGALATLASEKDMRERGLD